LYQDTVTRLSLLDWLVTLTTVAERTRPPVCAFVYVTRYRALVRGRRIPVRSSRWVQPAPGSRCSIR
jgi:hypothetical protein